MRGLLLKSWKNILPTFAYYCFFTAVFFAVSIIAKELIYFGFVCVMFSVAVPTASMARDEQDGWDKFALASGVTRQKFVLSGNLFALLVMNATVWIIDVWGEHLAHAMRRKNREFKTNPPVSEPAEQDVGAAQK